MQVSGLIYKWNNLTGEMAAELHIAREILKDPGRRTDLGTKVPKLPTWSQYCEDIGSSRQVINRLLKWLACYTQEEIAEKEECDKATISRHLDDLLQNGHMSKMQQPYTEHLIDFDIPLYNVWKYS